MEFMRGLLLGLFVGWIIGWFMAKRRITKAWEAQDRERYEADLLAHQKRETERDAEDRLAADPRRAEG